MSTIANTTFKITNTKLSVPIVILSSKDNVKLVNYQRKDLKDLFFGISIKKKIESKNLDNDNLTIFPLGTSFQRVRRLFVLAFDNTNNSAKKVERNSYTIYFLPRVKITDQNALIDVRNFYDQSINDEIKKYYEIRKAATGQGDDYTTGCLLDYQYFKDHYQLIADDFSKQKESDADSKKFSKFSFMGCQTLTHKYVQFQKNQKKQCQSFTREQRQFCN